MQRGKKAAKQDNKQIQAEKAIKDCVKCSPIREKDLITVLQGKKKGQDELQD